jgi:hypothetical protein
MKILLVEDHADSADVLAMLLRNHGYAVKIAGGVGEAMRIASEAADDRFDVLLCDLGLPDGSGLDLMRHLKSLYPIKGVAVTGSAMDEDVVECRQAGFEAHMAKPLAPEKLRSVLESLAGRPAR